MKTLPLYSAKWAGWILALLFIGTIPTTSTYAAGDTLFVDHYFSSVPKKRAHYYVIRENMKRHKKQWTWDESVYCISGQLHSTYPISCTPLGFPEKNGLYKEFYANGNVRKGIFYDMGRQVGEFAEYYPEGKLKTKGRIDEKSNIYIYNMYDSTGKDLLIKGNGLVVSYDSAWDCISYYAVKDSLKSHTFYLDSLSHDTIYTALENKMDLPMRPIIISDLPFHLVKHYRGQKLYVACLVNEEGRITRTRNKNSIQPQLDHMMMNKVKYVTDFKSPTLRNGKRVKAAVMIPLTI